MCMNKEDRKEVKELLHDVLAGHIARIESQYSIIAFELDLVKKQTTLTNSRVSSLEREMRNAKDDISVSKDNIRDLKTSDELHVLECPVQGRVKKLESARKEKEILKNVRTTFIATLVSIVTILGSLWGIFKLFGIGVIT